MKVKVVLSLLVVMLALLVVMAIPVYAGKGGPGKDKDKEKGPPPGQDKATKEMVTICHKPDTPAEKTLVVPRSAVAGHLGHGDYEGECEDTAPTDPESITNTETITICHKPGTPAEKTLVLPAAAGPGHLRHGDYEGECLDVIPSPVPTDTEPITYTETITICHKPGTPAEKTLILPGSAGPGHMRHGDERGACPEATLPRNRR